LRLRSRNPVAALLFLSALLAGCGRWQDSADFTFLNGTEPESLDPAIITGQPEGRLCLALFEGLISRNARAETGPGMAERWDISPDGKIYTFHLRPAKWSNGDPLTARDFHQSWERALNPVTASKYAELFYPINNAEAYNTGKVADFSQVGVRVIDDRTLEVELNSPTPFFLDLCAMATLAPTHRPSIEKWGDDWLKPGKLVSNGAYMLADWRIDDRVRLKANPHYWRKETVAFQTVDALSTNNATTAFNLFYSKKADLLLDKQLIPSSFIQEIRKEPYFHANPFLGNYFYRFNVTRKPLNDPRVRRALHLAIDKKRIVEKITRAGEQPAGSLTPPGIPGYEPPPGESYDPDIARKLLAEAGFPGGKGFPLLSILYNVSELHEPIATEIQAMWKEHLGILVNLRKQEWKVYLNSLDHLDYDIARSSWVGDYNDPNTFLDCFVTGRGNNRTGWSHAEYDRLLAQAAREMNPDQRMRILREAEEILVVKDPPLIPLYYYVGITLFDGTKLGGFQPNVLDEHPLREMHWIKK
jgi:oligopeptide transport system substrate-binding protein